MYQVGDIDIGCGDVVVGSLNGPGSVASRIAQPATVVTRGANVTRTLFNRTRQRLLRFEVLADGTFDFKSCGSRYGTFRLNFHRFDRFELDLRGHTQP